MLPVPFGKNHCLVTLLNVPDGMRQEPQRHWVANESLQVSTAFASLPMVFLCWHRSVWLALHSLSTLTFSVFVFHPHWLQTKQSQKRALRLCRLCSSGRWKCRLLSQVMHRPLWPRPWVENCLFLSVALSELVPLPPSLSLARGWQVCSSQDCVKIKHCKGTQLECCYYSSQLQPLLCAFY